MGEWIRTFGRRHRLEMIAEFDSSNMSRPELYRAWLDDDHYEIVLHWGHPNTDAVWRFGFVILVPAFINRLLGYDPSPPVEPDGSLDLTV